MTNIQKIKKAARVFIPCMILLVFGGGQNIPDVAENMVLTDNFGSLTISEPEAWKLRAKLNSSDTLIIYDPGIYVKYDTLGWDKN